MTRLGHSVSLVYLRQRLARPTEALPLDIFRVLVGLLVFIYFLHALLQARDFSSPDGLIDHELSQSIFWFTRMGLFHPGLSLEFFQATFLIACLCAVPLVVGYRVKAFAAILYVIAVCTYRWNFLAMYVDDSIIHLSLFWLLLLPVGRTLVLSEWLADRKGAWERWKREQVPGFAMRCMLWNLALIYLVAGLWKWTSPMWREGIALYVIFKTSISLSPDFWGIQHLPFLKLLNYSALVLEPLFPLVVILPRGNRVKYALLLALFGFHVGTLVTLQIPYANVACLAAMVIPFGGELMAKLRRQPPEASASRAPLRVGFSGAVALIVVSLLTLAMLSSAVLPHWRAPTRGSYTRTVVNTAGFRYEGLETLQFSFFTILWLMGVAQQYQLFNWIDDRNYFFHYEVLEHQGDGPTRQVEPDKMFPRTTRSILLQGYIHGITWMRVPNERQAELRSSLETRYARRYCRQFLPDGDVTVYSNLERIFPGQKREDNRVLLMTFSCRQGEARMQTMNLDP